MIIRTLNENGLYYLLPSKYEEKDKNIEFCQTKHISVITDIFNLFITELFPSYFKEMSKTDY